MRCHSEGFLYARRSAEIDFAYKRLSNLRRSPRMFAEISSFSDNENKTTARLCSLPANHLLAIACNSSCVISCFSVLLLFRLLILMFFFLSVGLLNFRIQIRAKLSCFACLFRTCRRFFIVLIFLCSCVFQRAVGVVLKFFGVGGEIFSRFVLVAPEALCGERGKQAFVLLVADGVFAAALVFRGAFHSFALPFVSLNFTAAVFEELANPCRDVLAARVAVSHNAVNTGGKTREEEHYFFEVQRRVSRINHECEVLNVGHGELVGRRKRLYILVNLFAEPRHNKLVATFAAYSP